MAEEKIIDNLPMLLNLGDWGTDASIIGHASAFLDTETNTTRLEIQLDQHGSYILEHVREIFELKAIGFAGIKRRPRVD